jgi:hypothetical protein
MVVERDKIVHMLHTHNVCIGRWWLYKHEGRKVRLVGVPIRYGTRPTKNRKLRSTTLITHIHNHDDEKERIDHMWIDLTPRLRSIQLGKYITLEGKVKVYAKTNGKRDFHLRDVKRIR